MKVKNVLFILLIVITELTVHYETNLAQTYTNPVRGDDIPKRIESWVPVRTITRGPAYHWFGYYDKLEFL